MQSSEKKTPDKRNKKLKLNTDGNKTVRTDSCSSPSISHEPAVSQYI